MAVLIPQITFGSPLTAQDLRTAKIFDEVALTKAGEPISGDQSAWICLPASSKFKRQLSVHCEQLGADRIEGPKAELQIAFDAPLQSTMIRHEYGLRHAASRRFCRELSTKISRMRAQKLELCIRGDFPRLERTSEIHLKQVGRKVVSWVFAEAKTKSLRASWW